MQFLTACKRVANTSCCWPRHISLGVITIYPQVRAASYPKCCTQRLERSHSTQLLSSDWAGSTRSPHASSQQGSRADICAAITWANAKCSSCIYPLSEKYISALQQPAFSQKAAEFLISRFFSFFLDYWARKIRHTYKTCQLENIVADSSELKTWSF